MATSTAEAELNACTIACQEIMHLFGIVKELTVQQTLPCKVFVDNQACIALSKNPIHTKHSKHFSLKLHFLREKVENGFLQLEFRPTDKMPPIY